MNDDKGLARIFSMLMIVATAMLGWMTLKDSPLPRVADERIPADVPADEQDVIARLWEDPLQAVQAELQKLESRKGSGTVSTQKHTMEAVASAAEKKAGSTNFCILALPIPDGPFPDDTETRLRMRYSLQMALAEENFAPENRSALGYFTLPAVPGQPGAGINVTVPYEWFVRRGAAEGKELPVLVLWLPEERFGADPLELLQRLQVGLTPGPCPPPFESCPKVFVIGPRSSDTLKKMVSASGVEGEGIPLMVRKLSIFSPQATTPDPLLGLEPQKKWADARRDLARRLHQTVTGSTNGFGATHSWQYLHNFIAPDDQLTDLIVAELALRGVEINPNSLDRILILSEADTQYGRSLPVALQASLDTHSTRPINFALNASAITSDTPILIPRTARHPSAGSQLLIYRYLRGLDQQKGHQGAAKTPSRSGSVSPEDALREALTKHEATPLGESQLDYVDRLAGNLQRDAKEQRIRAVGVLGGDLYDKMILLRSLRPRFPDAVFFTTDLDARMWHPDHLPFTRNVVVASSYGVTQSDPLPKIPPFRDCYQVAVFEACRAALRKAADPGAEIQPDLMPSVFELGRNGPEKLVLSSVSGSPGTLAEVLKALRNPVAPEFTATQKRGARMAVIGLLVLAVLFARLKLTAWRGLAVKLLWPVAGLFVSLLLLIRFWGATQRLALLPGGEPWGLNHGTSIWPTEMLRLMISCFVVTSLVWAWKQYVRSGAKLEQDFFLSEPSGAGGEGPTSVDAIKLFQAYKKRAGQWRRAFRVGLATVAYLMFGFGLVFLVDGGMPARSHIRGEVARNLDVWMMILSISCFLSLVFYVLDAVLICAEFLRAISCKDTLWPEALITREKAKFGVLDKDLAGYLDVRMAAEKSQGTGRLILLPFIIQLLFILSRNSYFDHWSWPGTLITIFVCNILICAAGWRILRHSATKIRRDAMGKLNESLEEVFHELRGVGSQVGIAPEAVTAAKDRRAGLVKLKKLIEGEQRGAYAPFFQDPALVAVVLPSGIFGMLFVIIRALFGGL